MGFPRVKILVKVEDDPYKTRPSDFNISPVGTEGDVIGCVTGPLGHAYLVIGLDNGKVVTLALNAVKYLPEDDG